MSSELSHLYNNFFQENLLKIKYNLKNLIIKAIDDGIRNRANVIMVIGPTRTGKTFLINEVKKDLSNKASFIERKFNLEYYKTIDNYNNKIADLFNKFLNDIENELRKKKDKANCLILDHFELLYSNPSIRNPYISLKQIGLRLVEFSRTNLRISKSGKKHPLIIIFTYQTANKEDTIKKLKENFRNGLEHFHVINTLKI